MQGNAIFLKVNTHHVFVVLAMTFRVNLRAAIFNFPKDQLRKDLIWSTVIMQRCKHNHYDDHHRRRGKTRCCITTHTRWKSCLVFWNMTKTDPYKDGCKDNFVLRLSTWEPIHSGHAWHQVWNTVWGSYYAQSESALRLTDTIFHCLCYKEFLLNWVPYWCNSM